MNVMKAKDKLKVISKTHFKQLQRYSIIPLSNRDLEFQACTTINWSRAISFASMLFFRTKIAQEKMTFYHRSYALNLKS